MSYFTNIRTTDHYLEEHVNDMPWDLVVQVICSCKSPRKKGDKFEIETPKYYVLFELKNKIIYVINAKCKR